MTSIRDLLKKSKQKTSETADKILDADIEQNFEKVKKKIPKIDDRIILLGIIFVIFIFFLVVVSINNWG
tara:strand:- start:665 stop:871 length:207 start_codon:yes stop_codon:yes gene_type:complete